MLTNGVPGWPAEPCAKAGLRVQAARSHCPPTRALQALAQGGQQQLGLDRDAMLKQIESLKAARQEAEQRRAEVARLERELASRQQQLEQLQGQHQQLQARLEQQQRELQVGLAGRRRFLRRQPRGMLAPARS
jgi:hypothetical protein